ncbi:MAG: hypothetical protein V3V14_09730 [Saprospiraceae bacterium]
MKILITIATSLFIASTVLGQNDSIRIYSISPLKIINKITIQSGASYLALKDQTFSPIVFSGVIPSIRLGFNQNRYNEKLWNTDISLSYGNIDYKNKYFKSTFIAAQFTFNYLWKIRSFKNSKIFLGGQFKSVLNLLDYDGFNSAGWFTAQQLEPILIYTYAISGRQSISGQFSYPIMSLVSRPSYAGIDEFVVVNSDNVPKILYSRMKLYSLNKLINPNIELKYSYTLKRSIFSISANYSYLQVNSVRKYYKNTLGLNLIYQLKIG